jgi:hypothetical protein
MRLTKVYCAATSMKWTRREFLGTCLAGAVAIPLAARGLQSTLSPSLGKAQDWVLLDELERASFDFFWNEADPRTGLVPDRAKAAGGSTSRVSSIAATGFGLTALCIGHYRGYHDRREIEKRVAATLHFLSHEAPHVKGFFYHFVDMKNGERAIGSEVSPIDMAILLCGALTCHAYFGSSAIQRDASDLYNRVDWRWATAGGDTFVLEWTPELGFSSQRWDYYCENLMLYLLSIGSPTKPLPAQSWNHIHRPVMTYEQYKFISIAAPLFVHQFSHAWFDFREKRDEYANYFENSTIACRAHREFCVELGRKFPCYSGETWGITSSDSSRGYVAWGGPPSLGPIDGTIVPAASAGSLPFIFDESGAVLHTRKSRYGDKVWKRYGFVDAFNPLTGWVSSDVIGIDVGISMLMAENARSHFVWKTFAQNPEVHVAMQRAGFQPSSRTAQA